MLGNILDRHYKMLLFKIPLSELEDKDKFLKYLKSSLISEYSFFELYNVMNIKEQYFYNVLKPNFPRGMSEEDKFFNFTRIYVQYLLKVREKEREMNVNVPYNGRSLENSSSTPSMFNGGGRDKIDLDVNVDVDNKGKKKVIIERKNKYTNGTDDSNEEDETIAVFTKNEYLNSIKKTQNINQEVYIQNDMQNMNQYGNMDVNQYGNMDVNQYGNIDVNQYGNIDVNQYENTNQEDVLNLELNKIFEENDLLNIDMNQYAIEGEFNTEKKEVPKKKSLFGGLKKTKKSENNNNEKKEVEKEMIVSDVKMSKDMQRKMEV